MSALVTLPGDIPGLLRRGAPVIIGGAQVLMTEAYKQGQSLRACFDQYASTFPLQEMEPEAFEIAELDLSEPAGRDIAARWMAERLGMGIGLTAPGFAFIDNRPIDASCAWVMAGDWGSSSFRFAFCATPPGAISIRHRVIPGLPLDPAQGVEAMRLCVLHLAGRLP